MKTLLFITSNEHKLREARFALSDCRILKRTMTLPEIQGEPEDIIRAKAAAAYKKVRKPLFVEDICLCFESLNGLPGPYIRDFLEKIGQKGLIKLLAGHKNKKATAKCYIGFAQSAKNIKVFVGETKGTIANKPRGKMNFAKGWDPIFIPNGTTKTNAEMPLEEKNKFSHRRKALNKFKRYLLNL